MLSRMRGPLAVTLFVSGVALGFLLSGREAPQVQAQAQLGAPIVARDLVSFRDVVKRVNPAVVSLDAKVKSRKGKPRDVAPQNATPFPKDNALGFGSGFIVDPKGVVVTCYHVVEGADWVEVTLLDGRKFTSQDIRGDRKTDLAVIRIQADRPLPFLELADCDAMEVGDRVLAVGAPFGLTGSVTHGIISAKSRNLRLNQYEDFIQTDAAINPGNSGGPLVNLEGKAVGINSAIKSRSGGFQGVGLAISSNLMRNVIEQLTKNGVVRRGYIGIGVRDLKELDADQIAKLGLKSDAGVLVTRVADGTPAKKGGILAGDVILSIGGKVIRDGADLQHVVSSLPIDKTAAFDIVRSQERKIIGVVIEEQPEEFGIAPARRTDE